MRILISLLRYVAILILGLYFSSLLNSDLTQIYRSLYLNTSGSFDIDLSGLAVLHLTLDLVLPFLFIILGDRVRYWAVGALALVILIPTVLISDRYISYHVTLIATGTLLGYLVRFVASKTFGKMPSLELMKKYF